MCAEAYAIFVVDDALVPLEAPLLPVVEPLLHLARMHKELQVPLLEFTLAEQEIPRRDLVAEGLPNLTDAERYLHTRGLQDVVIVQVNVLASLAAQVRLHSFTLNHADVRLHHQVEDARFGEFPTAYGALVLLKILRWQVVNAETALAVLAIDEPIYEVFDVPAGLTHTTMSDYVA